MRLAFRALLLVTGIAVMVATSPLVPPFSISVWLPAGGAQTVTFSARSDDGKKQVQPLLRVRTWRSGDTTGMARLVGIASPDQPPPEAYSQLDPTASYTVGQWVEGLGTVAFVQEVPVPPDTSNPEPEPLPLPEDETVFLTVFAPDSGLEVSMELAVPQMEEQCQCKLEETYPAVVHRYAPTPPDAGTGGHDGG